MPPGSNEASLTPAELYALFDTDPAPIVDFLAWLVGSYSLSLRPDVLDVGCGPGRLLRPLADRGWQVTGIEPDRAFRAQASATARGLSNVKVLPGSFSDITAERTFDLVIGINSSFAYLSTPEQRADALARCRRALRPGGVLFLDLPDFLRILFGYTPPQPREVKRDGRTIRLQNHHVIDFHQALFTTRQLYTVREADGREWEFQSEHPYAITALPDLEYLFSIVGFGPLRTFASYQARAPERLGGGRMLIAAQTD
jgi:SAM-dependent methyltransferase